MAAVESTIGGLVHGQINAYENWQQGYVCFNRRFMYAGLDWCTQNYSKFVDELRELCGGGVFQMPADISIMEDPQHPYTKRLMAAVPVPEAGRRRLRRGLSTTEVPSPVHQVNYVPPPRLYREVSPGHVVQAFESTTP